MSKNLTIKGIPDAVYERLKALATGNRRSLNSEVIVCLEKVVLQTRPTPSEFIAEARALRSTLNPSKFRHIDIDTIKREGRP